MAEATRRRFGSAMAGAMESVMDRRAASLAEFLEPHLPASGRVLDIGSGTGHNARALRRATSLEVVEADVVDMSVARGNRGPILFDGLRLPFDDGAFACSYLLFVLHYARDAAGLLREARRVSRGPVLVLQSVHRGRADRLRLRCNDLLWGRMAYGLGRLGGFVPARAPTTPSLAALTARTFFDAPELARLFARAGFSRVSRRPGPWPRAAIRRDLFILRP